MGQSNTVTATTLQDTIPPTAPELSGSVRGPSQVSLTWTRSTDDITWWSLGYRIFANGVPVTEHVNWYAETRVVLRHLTPATSYTFTVQADDFNGNTATSNPVTLTTEATTDVTPPSAPSNVHRRWWLLRVLGRLDPVHRRHRPLSTRSSTRSMSTGSEPAPRWRDFVYATAGGENTFTVKAVDRAGNTSEASNAVTEVC